MSRAERASGDGSSSVKRARGVAMAGLLLAVTLAADPAAGGMQASVGDRSQAGPSGSNGASGASGSSGESAESGSSGPNAAVVAGELPTEAGTPPSVKPVGADAGRPLFPGTFRPPVATPMPQERTSEAATTGVAALLPTVGPLALVLVAIIGLGWLLSRLTRGNASLAASARAPAGILEVLGRYPLSRGQSLVLLKLDQRVLLLAQSAATRSAPGSVTTLAELSEGEDVASILMKVSESEQTGPASKFNRLLDQFNSEPGAGAGGQRSGGLLGRLVSRVVPTIDPNRAVSWAEGAGGPANEQSREGAGVARLRERLAQARGDMARGDVARGDVARAGATGVRGGVA